ncbi:hypothetical protein [Nocardia sp. CA-290969]|uniref:hypothetical protein n=1 Tax=Nocardia sp. CA-290969 TaxID=3239986 RepID=UPI003D8C6C1E
MTANASLFMLELATKNRIIVLLSWRDSGKSRSMFLRRDGKLCSFTDITHLVAFLNSSGHYDLIPRSAGEVIDGLSASELSELVPVHESLESKFQRSFPDRYLDLATIPDAVARKHAPNRIATAVQFVRMLHRIFGLESAPALLDSGIVLEFEQVSTAPIAAWSDERWKSLRAVIDEHWGAILAEIESIIIDPPVSHDERVRASRELWSARVSEKYDLDQADFSFFFGDDWNEVFFEAAGVVLMEIVSDAGTYVTVLFCAHGIGGGFHLPGREGSIFAFSGESALARWMADNSEHGLIGVEYDHHDRNFYDGNSDLTIEKFEHEMLAYLFEDEEIDKFVPIPTIAAEITAAESRSAVRCILDLVKVRERILGGGVSENELSQTLWFIGCLGAAAGLEAVTTASRQWEEDGNLSPGAWEKALTALEGAFNRM